MSARAYVYLSPRGWTPPDDPRGCPVCGVDDPENCWHPKRWPTDDTYEDPEDGMDPDPFAGCPF